MKNLKNKLAAMGLMAVLGMSATAANAGIIISDKAGSEEQKQCKVSKDDLASTIFGVIVVGIKGVIVVGQNGLIISDGLIITDKTCPEGGDQFAKDGLLISD